MTTTRATTSTTIKPTSFAPNGTAILWLKRFWRVEQGSTAWRYFHQSQNLQKTQQKHPLWNTGSWVRAPILLKSLFSLYLHFLLTFLLQSPLSLHFPIEISIFSFFFIEFSLSLFFLFPFLLKSLLSLYFCEISSVVLSLHFSIEISAFP